MNGSISSPTPSPRQTFRAFWHGPPLDPYHQLCLRSIVDHGHHAELYTYDQDILVPSWVTRRDAREILQVEQVFVYKSGFGAGSPALHSDLFRYVMLQKQGDWWVDLDALLLRPDLPNDDFFFALGPPGTTIFSGVLKFPRHHPALDEAVDRSLSSIGAKTRWGDIGPRLVHELVQKYGLAQFTKPSVAAYPIPEPSLAALYDPERRQELMDRCSESCFLHLWNEASRFSGLPKFLGPPRGSFMDVLFDRHPFDTGFCERMRYAEVERWIENRNELHRLQREVRNMKAETKRIRSERDALQARLQANESRSIDGIA